jgi:hypothetical protein
VRSISPLPRLARLALALLVVGCGAAAAQGGSGAADAATAPPPAPDRALDDLIAAHPVFGPALRYRTVATDAAERALAAAADDLRRSDHGLSADLTWRPSVTWRGTEATAAPAVTWGSELTASFGYRTDAAAVVSARIALHRAGVAHLERVNRDLREAMTRHVELQRAWIARTLAEDAAAGRSATLASAERVDLPALAAAPGDPGPRPNPARSSPRGSRPSARPRRSTAPVATWPRPSGGRPRPGSMRRAPRRCTATASRRCPSRGGACGCRPPTRWPRRP